MVGNSVCKVLLAGLISLGVDFVPFRPMKDSYRLYPADSAQFRDIIEESMSDILKM